MNTISISRRRFAQLLGAGAACAVVRPALSLAKPPAATPAAARIVRLSSNENPYRPSPKAWQAVNAARDFACRYPDEHADLLIEALAKKAGKTLKIISKRKVLPFSPGGWKVCIGAELRDSKGVKA